MKNRHAEIYISDIRANWRRLVILCVAVAISVSAVFGVRCIALGLAESADAYFADTADIVIESNDGFTAQDIELVKEQTSAEITVTDNQLHLSFDFLRRYNTLSADYANAITDIEDRLDNISANRLKAIKDGSYDYRLLNISKYDKQLSDAVNEVYDKKNELEKTNKELVSIKKYIDRTEQLIIEKSAQLSISTQSIFSSFENELAEYKKQLEAVTAIKEEAVALKSEAEQLEQEYNDCLKLADDAKAVLDSTTDTQSSDYTHAKSEYDKYVAQSDKLKAEYDKKTAEYDKKNTEYEEEQSKYDTSYAASKETYDKLMSDTGIDSDEIVQMSLMNLTTRAEYNQKLEIYSAEFERLESSLADVVERVANIYSEYNQLWYLSDRSAEVEFDRYEAVYAVLNSVLPYACIICATVVLALSFFIFSGLLKDEHSVLGRMKRLSCSQREIIKKSVLYSAVISAIGYVAGMIISYLLISPITVMVLAPNTALRFTPFDALYSVIVMIATVAIVIIGAIAASMLSIDRADSDSNNLPV